MNFQSLDIFSAQFQMNVGLKQTFKKSKFGAFLSILVISLSILYFVYQLFLYVGNKIDPKFRMQTIRTDKQLKVDVDIDFVGFRYEYEWNKSIDDFSKENDKLYFIYIPFFNNPQSKERPKFLDVTECTNSDLKGFKCIDFSKETYLTLENNPQETFLRNLNVMMIRCQDSLLFLNRPVAPNCASNAEIESMMQDNFNGFKIKAQISQYNTTTQSIQHSYRTFSLNLNPNEYFYSHLSIIQSQTTVTKGLFGESVTEFTLPLDYNKGDRFLNRTQFIMQSLYAIDIEQQIELIQIQYSTLTEVIAICNSIFSLLCGLGIIGRIYAKQMIHEDIKLMLLQNIYQSDYINILRKFNILKSNTKVQIVKNDIAQQQKTLDQKDKQKFNLNLQQKIQKVDNIQIQQLKKQQDQKQDSPNCDKQQISQQKLVKQEHNKDNASKTQQQSKGSTNKESQSQQILSEVNIQDENENENENIQKIKESNYLTLSKRNTQKDYVFNDLEIFQLNSEDNLNRHKQLSVQLSVRDQIIQKQQQTNSPHNTVNFQSNPSTFQNQSIQNSPKPNLDNVEQQDKIRTFFSQNEEQFNISKCQDNLKIINNNSFEIKLQDILYKSIFLKKLMPSFRKNIDERLQQRLENQVHEKLNYGQIFKDIIFLKKAIMVLLSSDQYAAIQLIGCSSDFYSYSTKKENQKILSEIQDQKKQLRHLDQQFIIDESQEQQKYYTNKFIERLHNDSNLSEVDQRIFSSIVSS